MALSDLVVFQEYLQTTATEVLAQQVELFGAASANTIVLTPSSHMGDYNEKTFFTKISGLVRRRNAYGSGAVAGKILQQALDTMVKVAGGTPPIELDEGMFKWIQMNPEAAGAALGQQLAKDMLADMLNTGLLITQAALSGVTELIYDGTQDTPDTLTYPMLVKGSAKFGDRSNDLASWVIHSTPMHGLFLAGVTNTERLFTYGTVNVVRDPFGRIFVITDSPSLVFEDTANIYYTLGLVQGAISVDQNNDFSDNIEKTNGFENIKKTYQAEWTYNTGVMGFSWNKGTGGASPNNASLASQPNWTKIVTSVKDCAGVMVESN